MVKITDKSLLKELQSKFNLRWGRKLSQQEIIDICVRYVAQNIDLILLEFSAKPKLTPEKVKLIIDRIESIHQKTSLEENIFPNSEDEEIYNF